VLSLVALPGILPWGPIFATAGFAAQRFKRTGPVWDVFDEIAQVKLVYGLVSGSAVIALSGAAAWWMIGSKGLWLIPAMTLWMWMSLRWYEDATAASRAFLELLRLAVVVQRPDLDRARALRKALQERVKEVAIGRLGLPADPELWFLQENDREKDRLPGREGKGRVKGKWQQGIKYFSLRRRRKRDWNETLRWYDMTEFPAE